MAADGSIESEWLRKLNENFLKTVDYVQITDINFQQTYIFIYLKVIFESSKNGKFYEDKSNRISIQIHLLLYLWGAALHHYAHARQRNREGSKNDRTTMEKSLLTRFYISKGFEFLFYGWFFVFPCQLFPFQASARFVVAIVLILYGRSFFFLIKSREKLLNEHCRNL